MKKNKLKGRSHPDPNTNPSTLRFAYDVQVDFHGYTVDDALYELEELVFVHDNTAIMVIHGHGEGLLRNAIRSFAKKSKYVSRVEGGENLNLPGGFGVTVVYTR